MNILDTHLHKLRLKIDNDAPPEYVKRWNNFKKSCEEGDNEYIVQQIKDSCKLNINKNLPYLNRWEGGLGGNNNLVNKQIRFRYFGSKSDRSINDGSWKDNDIVLTQITSTEEERWTYEELDDLMYGFIKTANYKVQGECINGVIEMVNKNT
jgi:hypothetical protein